MASPWSRASGGMIVTTTAMVEGRPVKDYLGIVTGEVIPPRTGAPVDVNP